VEANLCFANLQRMSMHARHCHLYIHVVTACMRHRKLGLQELSKLSIFSAVS
jgi:hypothetical protein